MAACFEAAPIRRLLHITLSRWGIVSASQVLISALERRYG